MVLIEKTYIGIWMQKILFASFVCTDEKLRGRFTRVLRNFGRNFVHAYGHFATSPGNSFEGLADDD